MDSPNHFGSVQQRQAAIASSAAKLLRQLFGIKTLISNGEFYTEKKMTVNSAQFTRCRCAFTFLYFELLLNWLVPSCFAIFVYCIVCVVKRQFSNRTNFTLACNLNHAVIVPKTMAMPSNRKLYRYRIEHTRKKLKREKPREVFCSIEGY